jgi:protein tyrosine phosphatase
MAQRLAELYTSLDEVTLRSLFLEVVRVLPDSRKTVVDYLQEQNADGSLRRTVSLDNLVTPEAGFHVSAPALSKPKGRKSKIRCNGHAFTCHNYTKPTKCAVCNEVLTGLTHQGYQCKLCLLDVHYECGALLENCRGALLTKARKEAKKKEKKANYKKRPSVFGRRATAPASPKPAQEKRQTSSFMRLHSSVPGRLSESSGDDTPNPPTVQKVALMPPTMSNLSSRTSSDDPTYIQALPSESGSKASLAVAAAPDTSADDTPTDVNAALPPPSPVLFEADSGNALPDTRLPIAEEIEEEADSSDNSDYYEENSSDANSDSDSDESPSTGGTSFTKASGGSSFIRNRSRSSMKSAASSFRVTAGRGKTGASADWKKHGASFRARLSAQHRLTVNSLRMFLTDLAKVGKEFGDIPENRVNLLTTPKLTESKNRYMNILPNNHSRVLLDQIGDDETSSYINANWMSGYGDKTDEFIACQGPLPSTVLDFWRMVWQCNVQTIAMNTGLVELGKEKCERYWPAAADGGEESTVVFGDFSITATEITQVVPEFQMTKCTVVYQGETRDVRHFWWTKWPDKGVPETSNGISDFIKSIRGSQVGAKGPAIIHCSAGIGRTGCFLTINYCMHQFDKEKAIDILTAVGKMRQNRGMTVQTESQYKFIHSVMLKYMEGKLDEREAIDTTRDTSPPLDAGQIDASRLVVMKSPDRLLGSSLARKNSARIMSTKLNKRRSSEGKTAPPAMALPPISSEAQEDTVAAGTSRDVEPRESPQPPTAPRAVAGQSFEHGDHRFKAKTFVRPTECAVCGEMLSGLALQGIRCSRCKQDCHFWCLAKVPPKCTLVSNVKRQKSGLPSWPPNRPGLFSSRKSNLDVTAEEDEEQ